MRYVIKTSLSDPVIYNGSSFLSGCSKTTEDCNRDEKMYACWKLKNRLGLSVSEISQQLEISVSTAYSYLRIMEQNNLNVYKRYRSELSLLLNDDLCDELESLGYPWQSNVSRMLQAFADTFVDGITKE